MLLVVSPNLALDRILEVVDFRTNQVQRTRSVVTQPGGKGSNVARVFRQLGGEVALVGCVGRRNGDWVRDPLQRMGIHVNAIEAYDGESRVCTIIRDASSNRHPTVINEESPVIDPSAIDRLHNAIDECLVRATAVLVTGSLSRGLPSDFYAAVIDRANAKGVFTCIDATGVVLQRGLEAKPTLLKANVDEVGSVFGPLPDDPWEVAQRLVNATPSQTIVTLGEAGALLVSDGVGWRVTPPRISNVNPIGAGDAFAAGYLKGLIDGKTPVEALRLAAAVAASDAATPEPGCVIPSDVDELLRETTPAQSAPLRKT
jgi:1-phosphofructokinase family hexose kinase